MPRDLVKLEADLKKQWAKSEKEAKNATKAATTSGTKRKAPQDEVPAASAPAKKSKAPPKPPDATKPGAKPAKTTPAVKAKVATTAKAKTTTTAKAKATTNAKAKPAPTAETKITFPVKAKATPATKTKPAAKAKLLKTTTAKPETHKSSATSTNHPRLKQTAKRTGGFLPASRATARQESPEPAKRSRPKQTARRSRPFFPSGRGAMTLHEVADDGGVTESSSGQDHDGDESPPSYDEAMRDDSNRPSQQSQQSQSLGLLNGRYELECQDLEEWDYSDFSLILTLDNQSLWGAYDFGMFEGILYLTTRPYAASNEQLAFTWRGRENGEGETSFGDGNVGWLKFLGGGRIEGMINCYGQARFSGRRVSGSHTRSERDARSMRDEWNDYNEEEYEQASRARWRGSGW